MASQLQKGHTYSPGDVVDAADLNALVDNATALKGIISEQTPAVIASVNDYIILSDTSDSGNLRKALISSLPGAGTVTSVSVTIASGASVLNFAVVADATTTPLISLGLDNQTASTVLAGPVSGSATTPSFRALSPSDMPTDQINIAAFAIDWSLGSTFSKGLAANSPFTFSNPKAGQTIRVFLLQNAAWTATFPGAVRWPGGITPVMTTGAGRWDIFTFEYVSGVYFGTVEQNFF